MTKIQGKTYEFYELHDLLFFFTLIRVTDLNPTNAFLPRSQSGEVDLTEGLIGQMQVDPLRGDGELKRYCLMSLRHHYRLKQHSLCINQHTRSLKYR